MPLPSACVGMTERCLNRYDHMRLVDGERYVSTLRLEEAVQGSTYSISPESIGIYILAILGRYVKPVSQSNSMKSNSSIHPLWGVK